MKKEELQKYKEEIKHLYVDEKKTMKEIGQILGKSERTISTHLKNMGISSRSSKKINQEDFERLWKEGKNDSEIAEFFGVKELTIKSFRTKGENAGKFNQKQWFSQEEHKLNNLQIQFILGSMLGDLNIQFPKNGKNARIMIVHSTKQKELFMKKVELLGEFMGSYKESSYFDKRTNKEYFTMRGQSKAHEEITKLYNLFYPNGTKIITKELLNKIDHPIALAYWFMDDGTERGTFATNCFTEQEVDLLINWMKEKWDIECTKQKNKSNFAIHISATSRLKFETLIFPYVVSSMYYKLKYLSELTKNNKQSV